MGANQSSVVFVTLRGREAAGWHPPIDSAEAIQPPISEEMAGIAYPDDSN